MYKRFLVSIAVTASLLLLPGAANAVLTWDIEPLDGAGITDGAGTWEHDNGNINWNNGLGNVQWDNSSPDVAQFGTTLSTEGFVVGVEAVSGVTATGIDFYQGYTLGEDPSGLGLITLSGTAPAITSVYLSLFTIATIRPNIYSPIHSTASTLEINGYYATDPETIYSVMSLYGTNTYTGTLEVTGGGFVQMRTPGALSTASSGTVVNDGCTLNLYGDGTTTYNLADFHISGFGAGVLPGNVSGSRAPLAFYHDASTGPVEWQGNIVLDADSSIAQNNSTPGDEVTISGVISGGYGLTKTGPGDLILTGANTYTGVTQIYRGTVVLDRPAGPPILGNVEFNSSSSTYLILNQDNQLESNAVMSFTGYRGYVELEGNNLMVGGLSCEHETTAKSAFVQNYVEATASTLTIDNDGNYSYAGGLRESAGTLAVVKSGTGTQTLLGGNTEGYMNFSGGLTVQEGTLACNIANRTNFESSIVVEIAGTLDVSAWTGFNIPDGKSLSGDGTVVGNVAVAADGGHGGGVIAPGMSIGDLTLIGDLDVDGTLAIEYDSELDIIDSLFVSGLLDLTDATISFSDFGSGIMANGDYPFATYGTLVGNPADYVGLPAAWSVDYNYGGTNDTIAMHVEDVLQIPGDATGEGDVDELDAQRLAENWGATEPGDGLTWWETGDFDGDFYVGPKDAAIMAANWGYTSSEQGTQGVPEPGMLLLLATGLALLAMRRWR